LQFLASPALAVVQVPADASISKRQQVKIASKQSSS